MSIIYIYIKKKTLNVFKKIFLVLLILLVFIYIKYPTKIQKLLPQSLNIQSNNILTEDTIINKIKDVNKLIPLEIELSQTLTVDNTYFNLDIFKKSKKMCIRDRSRTLGIANSHGVTGGVYKARCV